MGITTLNEMHNDFMVYAKEVNEERAFPDVRDGLKPSQRRCLWEMYDKGYSSNKPHVKSAKVDGGVIRNWHPHGSEYSTFARMSQSWVNNIPEVDWHGANGSLLGGPEAAASRYTECRLSKASEDGFFTNIKKDVVDFQLNFSEDLEWPTVLPAIFPRLFVNGSQGIGYTIAQDWEPGNLGELVEKIKTYLKTNKVSCDNIYPDYPTAGIIINKKDIHTIYETGKGSVILRGKVEVDGNLIKITSLPYQVYVEPFITEVKELVNSGKLSGIEDIYNKSDDSGMLIEIECSDNVDYVLNSLYKLTDLQCTFSANQMALVNGVPELLTLEDYIKQYVSHNIECIKREYTYDLAKTTARLEIVNGLIKALVDIDAIIDTIKKSKNSSDAETNLVKVFSFTPNQAKAIVDMRLGKLAHLESIELNKEKTELDKKVKDINKILASKKAQEKEFVKRLDDFNSKYGWTRRTEVVDIDIKEEKQIVRKAKVSTEQFMVALTGNNELKKISLAEYRPTKATNIIKAIKVGARDKVVLLSNKGKMYKVVCNKLGLSTMKSSGTNITTLLPLENDERVIQMLSGEDINAYVFFITDKGLVKKMVSDDVVTISKSIGTTVMKLKDEEIIWIDLVNDNTIEIKVGKKTYKLDTSKFKTKGRGAGGVRGVNTKGQKIESIVLN